MNTTASEHNESENNSPSLNRVGNRTPFEVPANFFEKQMEVMRFELLNSDNKQPWTTPNDYFESNAQKIQSRIRNLESTTIVKNRFKQWYAVAAILLVTVCISLLWFNNATKINNTASKFTQDTLAKVKLAKPTTDENVEEMEEYILNNYSVQDLVYNQ